MTTELNETSGVQQSPDNYSEQSTQEIESTPKRRPKKDVSVTETVKKIDFDGGGDAETETVSTYKLGMFKLNDNAIIPEFKTTDSACFDLHACLSENDKVKYVSDGSSTLSARRVTDKGVTLHQGDRVLIPTGLALDIPQGFCLELYPRSGISFSRGITLNNCTAIIDSDYVEELFISITSNGGSQYIEHGERIAQAKLVKLNEVVIKELVNKPTQKTNRKSGFGSTGNK